MKSFYKAIFVFISCIFLINEASASHIMGADITYTYMGTNAAGKRLYFVRLSFYRDCCSGCLVAGPNDQLSVKDSCTGTTQNYFMNSDSCPNGCEVVTICPTYNSTCDVSNSPYPGVEKYVDTVTIAVDSNCSNNIVSWTDGSRNATISNLQFPSGQNIYIQAIINAKTNPSTGLPYATNSVYFTKNPVPFACLGNTGVITYSNGAVAPLGDSLVYTLINPLTGPGLPIAYTTGYSVTQPIKSNPPVTFDSLTGILSYKPTQTEVDVITFLVQEYVNGILVSSVMRDVQLTIINNCTIPAPPVGGAPIDLVNADTVGGSIKVCPGTPTSFDIPFVDPNGRNVTLTSDINGAVSALPGATFAQIGTGDSVIAHITWNPSPSDTGCHPFEITIATDDCPIPGNSVKSFSICVLTKVTVSPHSAIYCGTPIQLTATGGANATWTPTTGLTFPGSIYTPLAAPSVTTLYTFSSDCGSDTSLIIYNPPFSMSAGPGGTICQNNLIQLNGTLDSLYAPYSILWIPATGLNNPLTNTPDDTILNPVASPQVTTTYTLQVTANTGCIRTDHVTVTVNGQSPPIYAHATPDTICPGQQVKLWVTDNPPCGAATVPCTGSGNLIQVGTGTSVQNGPISQYPSPYGNYYESARHQYLFHASELYSLLGSGGQIETVAMEIGNLNSGSTLDNFTIRIGCVDVDSLTGYVNESLLTTVSVSNYTPVTGWNTHVLTTPYNWDGQSNLAIDFCFTNTTGSNINNKMEYTTTPFRSVWCTYSNDNGGECGITGRQQGVAITAASEYQRPNFKFNVCTPPLTPITWTPGTGPNGVTLPHADTTFSHPVNQTTYFVTLNDTATGCSSQSFVTVFVDTAIQFSVTPDTFICSSSPVKLHATATPAPGSGINVNNIVYTWTTRPSTATAPPSGTGPGFASPTVTATATTTYICTISGPGICNITDSATISLGNGLPVNGIVDSIKCAGNNNGKIYINMTAGTAPYTYTWSPTGPNADSLTNLAPGNYYLTVTDAIGCVGKDTFKLLAPTPLALTLDSSNIKCFGSNIDTIKALVSGGRGPYSYSWNPAEPNTNLLTNVAPGDYDLTATDASGCTISGAVNITQPTPIVSGTTTTNLSGSNTHDGTITVITSGGTGTYTYTSVPAISALPNATGLDTGTYIITVCDGNHCCVNDTAHISGPPPINIYFIVTNDVCSDSCNGTVSASAFGGITPYTFSWSTGRVTTNVLTDTIAGRCAAIYTVTVTDQNGITVSKDTTISAPLPVSVVIDSTPITCYNLANGQLKAIPSGGTGTLTTTWVPGGSANPQINLGPGMYIVNVTDAHNCPAADTAYLGQPSQVTATIITTDSAICFNQSNGFANVQAAGGRPPYTYVWSGSTSVDSFANNLAAGAQTVTVKDFSGCTASASFNIYQPTQLVINRVDTTSSHCTTSHDGVAVANVSGGSPNYTFSWDGTSTGNVDSITGLATGTHTLSVTDSKGCSTTASFFINIDYTLAVTLGADSVSCNGGSDGKAFVSQVNGTPTYTYQWSPSTSTTDSATGLSASTQSVTVTDLYQCSATGSVVVGQPGAIADVSYFADPLCTGQSNGKVWLSAGGTTGPYTYTFNGGAAVHPITDTITGLAAGTYTFIITDGRGCTKSDAVTLTDPLALQLPAPNVTNITCANDVNGIISLSPNGGTTPYSYAWSPGGYTDSTESNLGPNTYSILVTDANGCTVSVSITLNAPAAISDSFIVDSTSCPGSADGHILVNAWGGTKGDINPYTYSIDGVNYVTRNNFYNLAAGVYTVYVMDSQGCILQSGVSVYQPQALTLSINPEDSLINLGATIQLFSVLGNLTTQTINSYAWSPAVGLSCLDCPDPFASPYQTTQYYLTVNYGKNCIVTDSNIIELGPPGSVYIPNAFTPNGDGTNDNFEVFGTTLQSVGMKIFNRWGEKVFDSGDSQWATWDGTYRGVMQPPGVYVYYVTLVYLDGSSKTKEGSVTLIR